MKQSKYSAAILLGAAMVMTAVFCPTDAQAMGPKRKKGGAYENMSVVSAGPGTVSQRAYAALYTQQQSLLRDIDNLTSQMSGAKRSQIRKLSKRIDALNAELTIVERRMAAYPRSITDPNYQAGQEVDRTMPSDVQSQIDAIAAAKDAEQAGQPITSDDPELQRAYSLYEKYGENAFTRETEKPDGGVVYRVQIATGLPGHKSSFKGVDDVYEVDNGKGTSVYYSGSFTDYNAAKEACGRIKSTTRYRDAFVVAMDGDKRISLNEAKKLIR